MILIAIRRWKERLFVRFLAVGLLNTLFGYGVFGLLVVAGLAPEVALLIATVLGVLFNFVTTGRMVFASRDWRRLPFFAAIYGITYLVNLAGLRGLMVLGVGPLIAQAILLPLVVLLSFALNKLLVFRVPR